jgi:DNA-binding transcriptional LysR family regulator
MELRHLRYFVSVAELLSFRSAARRLRVAQPSLSRQVRDLEDEIGAPLFERDRRHVALTDAGRVLLDRARGVLANADAALQAARDAARGVSGALRIGNIGPLSAAFLPESLVAFREKFPRVEIEIVALGPEEQRAALLDGRIEVAFQALNGDRIDPRLSVRPVVRSGVSVVLPARHRLAHERSAPMTALANETLLIYRPPQGAGYETWVRRVCQEIGGFTPRLRRPAVDDWNALFGMVVGGVGLALMPSAGLSHMPARKGWVARPLRPRPVFEISAVWKASNPSTLLANYLSLLGRGDRAHGRSPAKTEA